MRLRPSFFLSSATYGSLPKCAIDLGLNRPKIVLAENQAFKGGKGRKAVRRLIREADKRAAEEEAE